MKHMKGLMGSAGLWLLLVIGLVYPQVASAQSPAPIGLWQGLNSGDYIWVQANGACSAQGTVNVSGTCTWSATSTGGVLTMTYQWTIGPAHIGWSIRWIDRNTILVNNVEQFVRRG
jgi:hypothetical protein